MRVKKLSKKLKKNGAGDEARTRDGLLGRQSIEPDVKLLAFSFKKLFKKTPVF